MPRIASKIGATLKGKNLREQILPFKSSPYGKEANFFFILKLVYYKYFSYTLCTCTGAILKLSETEKFCEDFREKFWSNFGFPYTFYTFSFLPQLKIGRSQPA